MSNQTLLAGAAFFVLAISTFAQDSKPGQAAGDQRDAKNAVAGLDVAPGLEATLFASEQSGLLSPSDIDIDHLGRVWVCEVVNYRQRNGERKEGDRILVIEDTNGDGVADKQSVFAQGRELDSALGICVLPTPTGKGLKVVVSCAPNVWIFTDEDGDLKADKKEPLFTNVGQPQHDHSTHAFVFGPDGKLYWNIGNTGKQVCDASGKPIVDVDGNIVNDNAKPYRQGMAFRCNTDGSDFEVLGHNFRNNYELTVDSFGTVWQSDNDDDGNKGVRINYVMEGGNFGYVDEMTGAGWRTPRTNLEAEIPLQHWHLNDPGVVPNLVQTGGGSPTGICLYEGSLLPEIYRNQIIHCDAGPNVVRAYPVRRSGAGYTAEIANILVGTRDDWFRPSDVCVAPDGSIIVSDWYDPGVGGHRMGDVDRGRLFRVAPPKTAYHNPKIDVSTAAGAISALKNPNLAARYLGWTALHSMASAGQSDAIDALWSTFKSDENPRFRARALALLTKIPASRPQAIDLAVKDANTDIRIAGLRLARQQIKSLDAESQTKQLLAVLDKLVGDGMSEVRRECALAVRRIKSPKREELWGKLAVQYNGADRWYLEALGIGAANDWDACLEAGIKEAGHPDGSELVDSAAARDIFWRSRGSATADFLAKVIMSSGTQQSDLPRYLRAFDFLTGDNKQSALTKLAFGTFGNASRTSLINTEAIGRVKSFDIQSHAEFKPALNRILDDVVGQPVFVTLVDRFNVVERFPELLTLAQTKPDEQTGIDAARVLLAKKQTQLLQSGLRSDKADTALATATVLSNSGEGSAAELLLPLAVNDQLPLDVRREAIRGAARSKPGATALVNLAELRSYDQALAPALSAALLGSSFEDVRGVANKIFPPSPGKDNKPLPPLNELAKLKGNSSQGEKLFATTGKCNTCHIVRGAGKEVGPNLSEIGSKLSRQAMFESIIFPSAGISHNYESWVILLKDGTTQTGIITSEDGESITVKGADAIARKIEIKNIDERNKQTISLMPADLSKILSLEEMTDVVEYLSGLKAAKK